jgi:hypothetical protein
MPRIIIGLPSVSTQGMSQGGIRLLKIRTAPIRQILQHSVLTAMVTRLFPVQNAEDTFTKLTYK